MSIYVPNYDEIIAKIATHTALAQNVHGVGANDVQGANDVTPAAFGVLNKYVIGNDLLHSHDAEYHASNEAQDAKKTITINTLYPTPSTIRIKFDYNSTGGTWVQIYKNGGAVGIQRNNTSGAYITYSEDLSFAESDTLELVVYSSVANAYIKNFRVYGVSTAITLSEAIVASNIGEATPFVGTNT